MSEFPDLIAAAREALNEAQRSIGYVSPVTLGTAQAALDALADERKLLLAVAEAAKKYRRKHNAVTIGDAAERDALDKALAALEAAQDAKT